MAHRLILRAPARTDLDDIEIWYGDAAPPVQQRLKRELATAWEHLTELPFIGRSRGEGWRTLSLARFPYTIWYLAFRDEELVVIGRIAHDRRDPLAWPG